MQGRRGENDDVTQILHTTPPGGLVVPFEIYELWPTFGSELWPI